jgi:alpha-D-xyloside xylohydrolase
VVLPTCGWYNLFTLEYVSGGTVSVPTPPDRFPVFIRAGSLLPLSSGTLCADDATLRELFVFCGADGAFTLYDDAGDGYEPGILIPMRYEEAGSVLHLDRMRGELPEPVEITVHYFRPDGSRNSRTVRYDGNEQIIRIQN